MYKRQPEKIRGICPYPLIAPETIWETDEGYRTNVIFPGGMILEDSGEVKIYYGASDTVAVSYTHLMTLFLTFFKIGAFTFGGGYAMIPLIQREATEKAGDFASHKGSGVNGNWAGG